MGKYSDEKLQELDLLEVIANELAENNRLKRLELKLLNTSSGHHLEDGMKKYEYIIPEKELEDMA